MDLSLAFLNPKLGLAENVCNMNIRNVGKHEGGFNPRSVETKQNRKSTRNKANASDTCRNRTYAS